MKKVYIVHGWTYSTDKWDKLIELLKAKGYEAKMLSVPGLTKPSDKVWDMDDYVEWLRDEIGTVKDPVVIAHSNGGRITLNYALKYPGHLKHAVLIDSAGVYHDELGLRAKRKVYGGLARVGKKITKNATAKKALYKFTGSHDYMDAPENMRKTMQNMIESDKQLNLDEVKVSASLIWGGSDAQTPLADGVVLAKALGAKVRIINGARHVPYDTHPQETLNNITEILRRKLK